MRAEYPTNVVTADTAVGAAAGPEPVLPPRLWALFTAIWLLFLFYPVDALLTGRHSAGHRLLVAVGAGMLVAGYLGLMRRVPRSGRPATGRATVLPLAILGLLALDLFLLTRFDGPDWLWFMLYASMAAGGVLPARRAIPVIAALTALELAVGWFSTGWLVAVRVALPVLAVGLGLVGMNRLVRTIAELRAARQELARLAVAEERLRFARDLHDLLGQSLSTVTLKAEVARRLVRRDPERAAQELGEVLSVARQALQEVRMAVGGYRQPTLGIELGNARDLLAAAGIALDADAAGDGLPAPVDAVLAWAVREGVTNVVRHSRASRCTIRIRREAARVTGEVIDDGARAGGRVPRAAGVGGNGLQGLAERAGALGGTLAAGPLPAGGYALRVTLPLAAGASA